MKKHNYIIFLALYLGIIYPFTDCNEGYILIDDICYSQVDIDVLNTFIYNSPNINLILDQNNNGSIEALELCHQTWMQGRLKELDCGPVIINGNYNWLEIEGEVPDEIGKLDEIEKLIMSYNHLSGTVSENICDLNLDFGNLEYFDFHSNDLCPPYPECIEDFMGTQSNYGSGFCELGNCYDVGVIQMTAIEINGDDLVNPYNDQAGISKLLITMHNNGPHCTEYPGMMVTSNIAGTSFPTTQDESSVYWWYAIFADDTYFLDMSFEISPYIPIDTEVTITAESVIMGCIAESCTEDPYCHDCPETEPVSITFKIGDLFPSKLGDSNIDGDINILDVVLLVSFVLNGEVLYSYNQNVMQIYLSNINQDEYVDVLDIVMLVEKIIRL